MTRKRLEVEIERLNNELSVMRGVAEVWKANCESAISAVDNLTARINAIKLCEKQRGTAIIEKLKKRLAKEPELSNELFFLICEIADEILAETEKDK